MNPHLGEAGGWVLLPAMKLGVGKEITVNQTEAFHTLGIIILESRGNVQYGLNGNETAYMAAIGPWETLTKAQGVHI